MSDNEPGPSLYDIRNYLVQYGGPHWRVGSTQRWYKKYESWEDPKTGLRMGMYTWISDEEFYKLNVPVDFYA